MDNIPEDTSIDVIKLFNLDETAETGWIECKEAAKGLPKSIWETYSAFANTDGGVILLGVAEKDSKFYVPGVVDANQIVKDLWATITNTSIVNRNILVSSDVKIIKHLNGNNVIVINVPQAQHGLKPIFLRGRIEYTYIRHGESDTRATNEEMKALNRNSSCNDDAILLRDFSMNDLDPAALAAFKSLLIARYKEKEYNQLSDEDLLIELGFFGLERNTQKYYPRQGCLLLFGKYNSIKDVFSSYHLDYIDFRNSTGRWIDRVASDVPEKKEMNLYNFFEIVHTKLIASDTNAFALDKNQMRIEHSLMTALREALVNTLAHADYMVTGGSIKIELHDTYYLFKNPGKMLVSIKDFETGGSSICRNEIIMKAFRLLGFAERQGMGGKEIISTAVHNKLMKPSISTDIMSTELKFWKIDAATFPDLTSEEQNILRFIINAALPVSKKEILSEFGNITERKMRSILSKLVETKKIIMIGKGKATKYELNPSSDFFRMKYAKIISEIIN